MCKFSTDISTYFGSSFSFLMTCCQTSNGLSERSSKVINKSHLVRIKRDNDNLYKYKTNIKNQQKQVLV